ncbi:Glutamyl-tRNA synthetase, class Ib, archaeal/eukaryotic cytosolic [Penicillium griseofulvum]|uniref:glutamate--tRNA ligase n=1 Tax=Penicillium patulum TaxID=5078 RepID=A0A135LKV7_PENPA|nr:Glutamyl-tRNA synthetase, class Ib, archaeal/eukaryotic cytosolic [Penicillium griseofulvum]KXG49574.1 Glutamyl-tRNA synthetase, class Ib, archaeal/eukaryotic cytosolic [Penicillium griseofulvum]
MSAHELKVATRGNHAALLPVVLIVTSINEARPTPVVTITYEDTALLQDGDKAIVQLISGSDSVFGPANVIQELMKHFPFLAGKDSKVEAEWISQLDSLTPLDFKALDPVLQRIDTHLLMRSFIVGYSLSTPDIAIWGAIRGNRVAVAAVKKGSLVNLTRWYRFLEELCPWTAAAVESMNAVAKEKKVAKSKEGASYDIALKNTENGVVTRFPPEPSGYLHIGHAKAALLNDYFAHEKYNGTMLLRFDDTNPSNEKQEFEDAIVEDLALMGIKPNKMTYTSDYFDQLYDYCIQIIKQGDAYADDTDKETMAAQRWDGLPSKRRDLSPEESLAHLEEMKKGTPEGLRWCIRAKISFDCPNKAMRDPVIYRCNPATHHRTGDKWKIYPTYDFACPIVDSMEGVTHALRTIEYRDRNPQYQWMLDTMKLRNVQVWDFARMNFVRTLLSKRKLTKLVETGLVWGWDDPRFPTIRGIRRRGMTIPALREFILKQGPSKAVTNFDWGLIWATNKKYIDPIAPRHTTIFNKNVVKTTVTGGPATPYSEEKPRHIKNAAVGMKKVVYSSSIILEQEDVKLFKPDEEITLMNWGNAIVRKVSTNAETGIITNLELELHMAGDVKKTEKKVTWLATEGQDLVPVELVDFDHLLTKDSLGEDDVLEDCLNMHTEFREEGLADCNVADLKESDIIQFDRKGYYRVDRAYSPGKPAVFFNIPSGKSK